LERPVRVRSRGGDAREPADRFFTEDRVARVTDLYGVAPTVEFCDIAKIVDNAAR
jgi:hypothetical protein